MGVVDGLRARIRIPRVQPAVSAALPQPSFRPTRRPSEEKYSLVARLVGERLLLRRIGLRIRNLPAAFDGYRIVHLTDLHFGPAIAYRTVMSGILKARELAPDMIVITGDFVTNWVDDRLLPDALSRLSAPDGVYGVLGNHDYYTDPAAIRRILADSGVSDLCNAHVPITRGDASLFLAGVDDVWKGQPDLQAALEGIPAGAPTVLLAHEPDFADIAATTGRVSLQLSGHAHGGSLRIPLIDVAVFSRFLRYARKYPYGLYHNAHMWLYTSAGVGRGRLPRVNALPDVTEITLLRHSASH